MLLAATVVLGACASGAALWWVVEQERARIGETALTAQAERDALRRAKLALEEERLALARRVAILERARQVEAEAYARVDQQMTDLQDQILALKEEVTFYRGIVSEEAGNGDVRIQRFVVEREGTPQDYRFRLVLTRGMRSDKVVTGAVSLSVDGDRDGERVRLGLEELRPFPVAPLEYRFKHFQRLEGRLRLPERFVPKRVVVQVDGSSEGTKPVRETFQWPSMKS